MTIEIGRNAEAHIVALAGEALHHLERSSQPTFVIERGSHLQNLDSCIHLLLGATCQPSTQMGCLHRTRTATTQHDEALLCETLAQQHHFLIHRIGTLQGVSTHDTQAETRVVLLEELVECYVDAVVVQGTRQRLLHVLSLFARSDEVPVHLRVVASLERSLVLGVVTGIELVGCVE